MQINPRRMDAKHGGEARAVSATRLQWDYGDGVGIAVTVIVITNCRGGGLAARRFASAAPPSALRPVNLLPSRLGCEQDHRPTAVAPRRQFAQKAPLCEVAGNAATPRPWCPAARA